MADLLKKVISGNNNEGEEVKEMGFLDHLEELRWHVIRAGIAVISFAVIALVF